MKISSEGAINLVYGVVRQVFLNIDNPYKLFGQPPNKGLKSFNRPKYDRLMSKHRNDIRLWLAEIIDWAQEKDNYFLDEFEGIYDISRERISSAIVEKANNKVRELML